MVSAKQSRYYYKMRIGLIDINNFRSVAESGSLDLGKIGIFVGRNNSGKSCILQAIYGLQERGDWTTADIRQGAADAQVRVRVTDVTDDDRTRFNLPDMAQDGETIQTNIGRANGQIGRSITDPEGSRTQGIAPFASSKPGAFIYPFFTRRRAQQFGEQVGIGPAEMVAADWTSLGARLDQLGDPEHPHHEIYRDACREVLGFVVTAVPSGGGKRPGIITGVRETIMLEQLGAGVANIVVMLAHLVTESGCVFLIEEPENDLHPAALKALLNVMRKSAERNQILLSTHSHVVVHQLGSMPSATLHHVEMELVERVPTTTITSVADDPTARAELLVDLGYDVTDFGFWAGWIVLEEASAEAIIRDVLIPMFAPSLSNFRTMSARGANRAEAVFDDYCRLLLFLHLEPSYRGRAWVLLDGDLTGKEVQARLSKTYPTWSAEHFVTFDAPNFENYYPKRFQKRVIAALNSAEPEKKRLKHALAIEVHKWALDDMELARTEFESSAASVIEVLRGIASGV
jgi:predicted ATPase